MYIYIKTGLLRVSTNNEVHSIHLCFFNQSFYFIYFTSRDKLVTYLLYMYYVYDVYL